MEENKFKCNVCKKYYKSYQSLWNHTKRFHVESKPDSKSESKSESKPESKPYLLLAQTNIKKHKCKYCSNEYVFKQSKWKHENKCKLRDNDIAKEEMKKEIAELREMVAELIKNKSNITNNNGTTNNNNGTTNNNNGTINNNYITIVPFGQEKFVEVTTEKEHLFILKQNGNDVLYKCIEMKHFNEELPQFHNYMRTNNRTDDAKIYDETVKDFKLVDKDETVDEVIMNAEDDIDNMYNLHKNKIGNKHKENVRRIIDEKATPDYVEEHVNSMAYDYRNMVMNTHKKNRKNKSIK